jgi:hypothetical protein
MKDTPALAEARRLAKEKKRKENQAKAAALKLENKKSIAREPIGTTVGNKQRMAEFKEKLLNSVTGESIIRKTLEIAQNDEHPGQMTALKMCLDRLLPTSLFEEKKDGSRTAVNITITGIGEPQSQVIEGEVIDGGN